MRLAVLTCLLASLQTIAAATSTQGLYDLVERRLPGHCDEFLFVLHETPLLNSSKSSNDNYAIAANSNGSIAITGNSLSALATGLRRYFTEVTHTDVYWFIGSRWNETTSPLPRPNSTITGTSIVPWRYYFNTVTFSYTTPFWSWEDWELELDWLALHGVNLALAWVGYEKILLDVFQSVNLTSSEILPFFSGPAFQAWNRFGNLQGSWEGELPMQWIDSQFELQQKILKRMLELGMTPILPAFTGFVPRALTNIYPNATVVNGSQWEEFPTEYTNTTFLEPSDPLFIVLQDLTIKKQIEYYGNITQFYTLDQYNENDPFSGDLNYLHDVTHGTWQSLKSANPAAIWVMQGWLFTSNADFWTSARIEAYLSGVKNDADMLILDLFSESQPQWQRTNSYYGKSWIWNMLHNYGGNMGLYGQIANVTVNPIEALASSSSLVGMGCTPEGQQGNEIMYKLLLDQAWQSTPIDTAAYFHTWTQTRYTSHNLPMISESLYTAWELLRTSAYSNTNLTSNAVSKAIFELAPNITRLVGRTGHHPTTVNYAPDTVVKAWKAMIAAANLQPNLWGNPAYTHDIVDVTRQVFSNAFITEYEAMIVSWKNSSTSSTYTTLNSNATTPFTTHAKTLTSLLKTLDIVLSTLPQFRLATWLDGARSSSSPTNSTTNYSSLETYYAHSALNQVTLWGTTGQINDYASKSWSGLVGEYYYSRWNVFLEYLGSVTPKGYGDAEAKRRVVEVEKGFQEAGLNVEGERMERRVKSVVDGDVVVLLKGLGML